MTPPMVLQINILQNEKGQAPLHAIGFFIEMKRALLLEIYSITQKVCAVILVWISRISTKGVLFANIRNQKKFFGFWRITLPYGNDCVLSNCHWQHRVALIVNMFADQVHSPCTQWTKLLFVSIETIPSPTKPKRNTNGITKFKYFQLFNKRQQDIANHINE